MSANPKRCFGPDRKPVPASYLSVIYLTDRKLDELVIRYMGEVKTRQAEMSLRNLELENR